MFKNKKGFTFIELSVVILIISILFAGTSVIFSRLSSIAKTNETKDKLQKIEKALKIYFLENQNLPCPAGLKLTKKDDDFGVSNTDCTAENTDDGIYKSGDLIYGAIPFKDLNIYPDFTYDSWGNKFSYVINGWFVTSSTTFAKKSGKNVIIINKLDDDVSDTESEIIKNDAIVLIISHGANGKGAFRETLQNTIPTDGGANIYDEFDNIYSASFDNNFIDNFKTNDFDDILKYFDKEDFTKETGSERIGCLKEDITDYVYSEGTITWTGSGFVEYEKEITADDACNAGNYPNHYFSRNPGTITNPDNNPSRKCLKNGQWSDVMYGCIQGCGNGNGDTTLMGVLNNDPGNFANYKEADFTGQPWLNVGLNEEVILNCTGDKKGSVTITCSDKGIWINPSGNCVDDNAKIIP